jgi:hypothetical protein
MTAVHDYHRKVQQLQAERRALHRFNVGRAVLVTGHYDWCGHETHGEVAIIQTVHSYAPGTVPGDVLIEASIVVGAYTDHSPAFMGPVPFLTTDVTPVRELP